MEGTQPSAPSMRCVTSSRSMNSMHLTASLLAFRSQALSSKPSASEMTSLRSHASGAQPIRCRSWEAAGDLVQHGGLCQSQWSRAHTADAHCPSPRSQGPSSQHSLTFLSPKGPGQAWPRFLCRESQDEARAVEKRRERGGECVLPGGGKEEKASGTKGSGDSGGEGGRSPTTTFSACTLGPSP